MVYSTWTFEQVLTLKGHQGKTKSIYWSSDDTRIISCGMDGKIYDWNARTGKKEWEHDSIGVSFSSVCYSPDSKYVYALASDGVLKVKRKREKKILSLLTVSFV